MKKTHKHGLFSLAIYHIGLEKIEGSWRWTRNSTLVFDPSLCYANEPNGQSLCGCFVFNVGVFGGGPVVTDVPCTTLLHIICELWTFGFFKPIRINWYWRKHSSLKEIYPATIWFTQLVKIYIFSSKSEYFLKCLYSNFQTTLKLFTDVK